MVLFSPYMSSMKVFLLVTWEYVYIEINRGRTSKSFIEPKSMTWVWGSVLDQYVFIAQSRLR